MKLKKCLQHLIGGFDMWIVAGVFEVYDIGIGYYLGKTVSNTFQLKSTVFLPPFMGSPKGLRGSKQSHRAGFVLLGDIIIAMMGTWA